MRHVITLALLVLAISGCTATNMYTLATYDQDAAAGKVPPRELVKRCNQDGLRRDAAGAWQQDEKLTRDCYAAGGWERTGLEWQRLP